MWQPTGFVHLGSATAHRNRERIQHSGDRMTIEIRLARIDDAPQVLAIYAPFVIEHATSFEIEPPDIAGMRERINAHLTSYPWIVCERDGDVIGYAYAGRHRDRAAYQWAVEVTVYVHEGVKRCGAGRALYTSLFQLLALQGFRNAYAVITLPNDASVGLHVAMGFEPIGVYRSAGYKLDAWHDVGWYARYLGPYVQNPDTPRALSHFADTLSLRSALAAGAHFMDTERIQKLAPLL